MNNEKVSSPLPKQPEADENTPEEVGSIAVENSVDMQEEKTVTEVRKETSNPLVKILVIAGVVVVSLGLLSCFISSVILGITLIVIGSAAIIIGIYMPIGVNE